MLYDFDAGNFNLISEERFAELASARPDVCELTREKYNFCPDCMIPMMLDSGEYQCNNCGLLVENESSDTDRNNIVSCNIKVCTGSNRGKYYNQGVDYAKTQKKTIRAQLAKRATIYTGRAFSNNILNAVATQYNDNQQLMLDHIVNGVSEQKKFVHRADIKNQILASLIHFEGIRENSIRKKRDIAEFMGLTTSGFAEGDDIVRSLAAKGHITLPLNEDPICGYSNRYLDSLSVDNAAYAAFITDLVQLSEDKMIAMSSSISSKVTGALWIIVTQCKLKFTIQQIEVAADNTKKTTFMKFYKVVFANIAMFKSLFIKHGIPLPK